MADVATAHRYCPASAIESCMHWIVQNC